MLNEISCLIGSRWSGHDLWGDVECSETRTAAETERDFVTQFVKSFLKHVMEAFLSLVDIINGYWVDCKDKIYALVKFGKPLYVFWGLIQILENNLKINNSNEIVQRVNEMTRSLLQQFFTSCKGFKTTSR